MFTFTRVDYTKIDIDEYYSTHDKSVFTTIPWMNYLLEDNPGSVPVVIRITQNERFAGYFTGLLVKKLGVKILGSPFRGWSTCFMGVETIDELEQDAIVGLYKELQKFLMKEYKCQYMSISDRKLSVDLAEKHFRTISTDTLELHINRTDDELFKVFKTDCRNFIRQFERRGAILEIAEPNDLFAEEYYKQLIDVFDKQGLVPTYSVEKVKCLLHHLGSANMVLCLRVKDPDGNSIASSIYPGYGNKFFFWGGASDRSGQHYRPNEYMIWTAIKYWRDRGAVCFDMVGVRDYKKKFGPDEVHYATIEFARPAFLIKGKDFAERMYFKSLEWRHKDSKEK